jgi:predicted ferric reductase
MIGLCMHLYGTHSQARICLLSGTAAWAGLICLNLLIDCYYNIHMGRGNWLPRAKYMDIYQSEKGDQIVLVDACHLEIRLHRSWNIQAGQYVFVRAPGLGFLSIMQSRPFWIVWWDIDHEQGILQLDMLVRKRRGFMRYLSSSRDKEHIAWISRPFGQSQPFGDYGSILMFATDIGIAAHLPYLKTLMQGRSDATIRTRRVLLVWQIKENGVSDL